MLVGISALTDDRPADLLRPDPGRSRRRAGRRAGPDPGDLRRRGRVCGARGPARPAPARRTPGSAAGRPRRGSSSDRLSSDPCVSSRVRRPAPGQPRLRRPLRPRGLRRRRQGRRGHRDLHGLPDRSAGDAGPRAGGREDLPQPRRAGHPAGPRGAGAGVHLLGVDRVLVVPHTRCAMASKSQEEMRAAVGESAGQDASWQTLRGGRRPAGRPRRRRAQGARPPADPRHGRGRRLRLRRRHRPDQISASEPAPSRSRGASTIVGLREQDHVRAQHDARQHPARRSGPTHGALTRRADDVAEVFPTASPPGGERARGEPFALGRRRVRTMPRSRIAARRRVARSRPGPSQ